MAETLYTPQQQQAWFAPGGGGYQAPKPPSNQGALSASLQSGPVPAPSSDPFTANGGGVQLANGDWVPQDHPMAQQAVPPPAPAAPGAPPATPAPTAANAIGGTATVGATPAQGSVSTVPQAFQAALINKLAPPPVTTNDPRIEPSIVANKNVEQRGYERDRAQLAEQAAAQGLDQNAFTTQNLGLSQDRSMREGAFAGQAVQHLSDVNEQAQQQAMSLASSLLSQQDQLALQRELAQLEAELTKMGITAQSTAAERNDATQRIIAAGQLNFNVMSRLLSNQEFLQGLSANIGMWEAGTNATNTGG